MDIDKRQVIVKFAIVWDEEMEPVETNALSYRLIWYNKKDDQVYIVDPKAPGGFNTSYNLYNVPLEEVSYKIEKRNLFGIDQQLVLDLYYTNYILGWLGPLATLLRMFISPTILGALLIQPLYQLNSVLDDQRIYFNIDSLVNSVILQWFWPNLQIAIYYAFGDLMILLATLLIFANFYFVLGFDWTLILSATALVYIMQQIINLYSFNYGLDQLSSLEPAATPEYFIQ